MKKLSKEPLAGRGIELIQSILASKGIHVVTERDRLKFALRDNDQDPSCNAPFSRDGGWVDFGNPDPDTGKGDSLDLVARLHGLDVKKDFAEVIRLAYDYLKIPIAAPAGAKEKDVTTQEELASHYGLDPEDFRNAGVSVGPRYIPDKNVKSEMECAVYPLTTRDGKGTEKWKSFARNPKGRRYVGTPKGGGMESALFGDPAPSKGLLLVLTGGEEKVLAARKAGFIATSPCAGEKIPEGSGIAEWIAEIGPSEVIIAFDNDPAGNKGTEVSAGFLLSAGVKSVRSVVWPQDSKNGADLNDVLIAGGLTGLRAFINAAKPYIPRLVEKPSEDAPIRINTEEGRVGDEVIAGLAKRAPNLFQRVGALVRIIHDADPIGRLAVLSPGETPSKGEVSVAKGTPTIDIIPEASIRELITRHVKLEVWDERMNKYKLSHPPNWLPRAIHQRRQWDNIRPLTGIAESPFLRDDGSLAQENGYDEATGMFCRFNGEFMPVVPDPPLEAVQDAVRTLCEAVVDFPFAQESHKSTWIAALLSVVCRQSFNGRPPFFAVDANIRGTGKTLLAHLISIIAFGRECAPSSFSSDDEESRKQITTALLTGAPMFLLDDVDAAFGGTAYNRVITSSHWRDRLMGGNRDIVLPTLPVWFVTGNNLTYRGDIVRRLIPIRLESREEHPEDRTGFQHPNLLEWARSERANLHAAALTIMAGFFAAGKPSMGLTPLGSFEAWSQVIRSAVVWAGLADPCEARASVSTAEDADRTFAESMINILKTLDVSRRGISSGDIIDFAEKGINDRRNGSSSINVDLLDVLSTIAPRGSKIPDARTLGVKLAKLKGRVVGGFMISSKIRRGSPVWRVATPEGAEVQELNLGEETV